MSLLQESIGSVKAERNAAEEEKKRRVDAVESAKATAAQKKAEFDTQRVEQCKQMLEESQISVLFDDFNNDYLGSKGTFLEDATIMEHTKHPGWPVESTDYTYAQRLHGIVNSVPVRLTAKAYITEKGLYANLPKQEQPHIIVFCSSDENKKLGLMDRILRRKFEEKSPSQRSLWTKKIEPEEIKDSPTGEPSEPGLPEKQIIIKEWQDLSLVSRYLAEVLVEQKVV